VDGTLYFRADNGVNGVELWKSDGTAAGTVLVDDIRPGGVNMHSNPQELTNVSGTLFFRADDGVDGIELWAVAPLPTATLLSLFEARSVGQGIEVRWRFASEPAGASVELQRSEATVGPWGTPASEIRDEAGVTVAFDRDVAPGRTYFYRLVVGAGELTFGPRSATVGSVSTGFSLSEASPNPTSGVMSIGFTVAREARIRLTIADVSGRQVALLAQGSHAPGHYTASWNGRSGRGRASAGMYFVRYETPERAMMRRIVLSR
jgi:ELWxxDGT repeat protein